MALKPKKVGTELSFRSFEGKNGRYIAFRTGKSSFHVFSEVEAKDAARDCGAPELVNTREMWKSLWKK
jgi:hypothetical protein